MITYLDIVTQAYRMAGVLKGPGRGLSGSEQAEGQAILNGMLDALKTERCFAYYIPRTVCDVTPGKQDYTVGARGDGADWVLDERPEKILEASYLLPGATPAQPAEIPMDVLREFHQWRAIVTKQVGSTQPRVLFYEARLPVGTAHVWPVPAITSQVAIYTIAALLEVTDLNADARLPAGYRELLEYQLACQVHDRYPKEVMLPNVEIRAREFKSRVMANQLTPLYLHADAAVLKRPSAQRFYDARTWYPG